MTSNIRRNLLGTLAVATAISLAACGGGGDDEGGGGGGDAPADSSDSTESSDTSEPAGPATTAQEGGTDITISGAGDEEMEAVSGGTLRYALEADVDGLNPTSSALSAPGLQMGVAVFDTLATFDTEGNWQPWLAESFTPNEDYTVWTMTLRPDVTFHDGEPLNADAVLANFEAQRTNALVGLAVAPFFPETGGAVKVDDLTVEFHPLDANAHFPAQLGNQLGLVASPKWLEAAAADPTLNQQPVGTGPFKFDSRSEDSVTTFVRNDDWWGGEVYLDSVEFYPITDSIDRVDQLLNGDIDALQTTDQESTAKLTESEGVNNLVNTKAEESFAMMNTSVPPFDDIRARQAITHATPWQDYVDLIGLDVSPGANQMFTPESKYYNPDIVQQVDMPELAGPLVEEYCAEKGTEQNPVLQQPACTDGKINIELQWSGPSEVQTRIGDLLKEDWSEFFNVTFNDIKQDEHIADAATGAYNIATYRQFGAVDPSADNVWLMCRTVGGLSINWPRYCDEERDQILLDAMASDDEATRVAKYQELSQKLNDDYIYIFFTHTAWDNATASTVHGVCDRTLPDSDEPAICSDNGKVWLSDVWIEQ